MLNNFFRSPHPGSPKAIEEVGSTQNWKKVWNIGREEKIVLLCHGRATSEDHGEERKEERTGEILNFSPSIEACVAQRRARKKIHERCRGKRRKPVGEKRFEEIAGTDEVASNGAEIAEP